VGEGSVFALSRRVGKSAPSPLARLRERVPRRGGRENGAARGISVPKNRFIPSSSTCPALSFPGQGAFFSQLLEGIHS
jgi:hypothetical protein